MAEENKTAAPDIQEASDSPIDKVRQWMYYFIIGIISFIALAFLPMLGGTVGLGWNLPNTAAGWIVWAVMKVIVATLNLLIFYSFMQQGKLNVKDHPNFVKAQQILQKLHVKNEMPRSPKKWNGQQYGKKGVTIFFSTALATIALTQAILSFNWVEMLTYLFTIIMGIIFGILQMKNAEDYWKEEYLRYAYLRLEEQEAEKKRATGFSKVLKARAEDITGSLGASPLGDPVGPAWGPVEIKEEKNKEDITDADNRR